MNCFGLGKKLLFTVFLFIFVSSLFAQIDVQEKKRILGAQANFSYEFPGGDMALRFGSNANVGGGFFLKTKSNFLFNLEGNYLFGEVINEDTLFHQIKTSGGYIVDGDGMYADVRTYERGFTIMAKAGRIFRIFNDNPNSGLALMIGGGFLQHKIRIENPGQTVPQINGDYKMGYDKLTNGPALSQYLGYVHYSDKRIFNFSFGFEFTQAFTKAYRNYDFDYMGKDLRSRIDLLYGIKLSWMIPFNKRIPKNFYYN
ncbi:MAG: hypothetical protein PHT69_14755 [Bacteroidales bacterium]|nr:hypothetical protein [Bacteroidales bacterium]